MAVTQGHGNPSWSRDETILALDLYFRCAGRVPSSHDPRVVALSEELAKLPIHSARVRKGSFRNPEGVAFKLQNLRMVATGRGLGNVSAMDRIVWAELGDAPSMVAEIAARIRREAGAGEQEWDEVGEEFFEGRLLTRAHTRRERDPVVRARLIARRAKGGRTLACDACEAGPRTSMPELLDAGFEAHHTIPLMTAAQEGVVTKLSEMALLCATCHRVLHRVMQAERRWIGIKEFKTLLVRT